MADLFESVDGLDELFNAQLTHSAHVNAERRTWCNVMDMFPHLPEPGEVRNVIDLGCGSGRVSVGLANLWDEKPRYWMVDGDAEGEIGRAQWGVFGAQGKGFYSRHDVMIEFCNFNSLCFTPVLIDSELAWSEEPKGADVLISMYSIGNHYPITMYEDRYPRILKNGALVFLTYDPRTGEMPSYFEIIHQQQDSYKKLADIDTPGEFVVARYRRP